MLSRLGADGRWERGARRQRGRPRNSPRRLGADGRGMRGGSAEGRGTTRGMGVGIRGVATAEKTVPYSSCSHSELGMGTYDN